MTTRPRFIVLWLAVLAGAVGLLVFWPCVRNGLTHWDDPVYLDPIVGLRGLSLDSVRWVWTQSATLRGYYHPVTWLSLLLDYQLWGLRPFPYHMTNLLLHVLNTLLVVVYGERLLRAVSSLVERERYAVALAVGIVFAIHPLQVESVAWIAERKTLLCAAFILASLYAQVKLAERPSPVGWWWAMNGWFALALLSKPMAVPLPGIMLVIDWYPLRRHRSLGWWRLWKEKLLMFILSACLAASTVITQSQTGAMAAFGDMGVVGRALVAARSLAFYVWKLVWPAWLSPFYPMSEVVSVRNVEFLAPALMVMAVAVTAVTCRRRWPALGAAAMAYALFLAPVSGVIPLGGYAVGDRYAYLAMVPVLMLVAGALALLWRRCGRLVRASLAILIGCQILFYAYAARGQIGVWWNDETIWREVWSHFPDEPLANSQLALALIGQSRFEEALPYATRAIELIPDSAEAHATAGTADLKLRRYGDAARELGEAVRRKPTLFAARYNLACAYTRLGRLAEAYSVLQELLASQPEYASLAVRDGELAALRGDPAYAGRFAALIGATKN
jgi:hypothetical protein